MIHPTTDSKGKVDIFLQCFDTASWVNISPIQKSMPLIPKHTLPEQVETKIEGNRIKRSSSAKQPPKLTNVQQSYRPVAPCQQPN